MPVDLIGALVKAAFPGARRVAVTLRPDLQTVRFSDRDDEYRYTIQVARRRKI
jgi:hypothetical protein